MILCCALAAAGCPAPDASAPRGVAAEPRPSLVALLHLQAQDLQRQILAGKVENSELARRVKALPRPTGFSYVKFASTSDGSAEVHYRAAGKTWRFIFRKRPNGWIPVDIRVD